jgi:ABC-type branched-subunit amino acid transport system ATPase component
MPAETNKSDPTVTGRAFDVDVAAARRALDDVPREPGSSKPDPILVADHVVRRFGGLVAVDVAHVEVQRGVITALIGPNGAGKTTFFNLLTGFDRPDEGTWSFNGRRLVGVPAYRIARMGMTRTFQLTKVLARLTVMENMRVGAGGQSGERLWKAMFPAFWRSEERANTEKANALLERFMLDQKEEDFAGSLSGGQRKLLEMARSLMTDPELVMLDEPMAGVNPALKQSLLGHVKTLRDEGRTVLFVEHDMDMVRDISDWVIVMAQGQIVAEGPPESVMSDQRVIDAYLGAHHDVALTFEEEEKILAEAEAELAEIAEERQGAAEEPAKEGERSE